MLALDVGRVRQVGEGAGHLDQPVRGTQGQPEALAGLLQPMLVVGRQRTVLVEPGQVEEGVGAALASQLPTPGSADFPGGGGTVEPTADGRAQVCGFAGDRQVQVDAVQQRAGEPGPVALDLLRRAAAAVGVVAQVAAGAGVHGRHQLEARREAHPVVGSGDDDLATFQGLSEDLQHLAVELRQLVEEQHTLVRQGDLAGFRTAAPRAKRNR